MKDLVEINMLFKLFDVKMVAMETDPYVREEAPVGTWHFGIFKLHAERPYPHQEPEWLPSRIPEYRFRTLKALAERAEIIIGCAQILLTDADPDVELKF
jgi:hypothetical protein